MEAEERPFQTNLLDWYDRNRRHLPWRAAPGTTPDPYHVWLSEIMLQQTTVATVKSYFEKFLTNWPDIVCLSEAPLDDVLSAWAGLGYYARARNLHKCARMVVHDHGGVFPCDYKALLALPGIGPYTAGAIAAIAFDLPFAAVDGNVERVLSRYFAIVTPLPQAKAEIHKQADALLPQERSGDFAQAMMDLGAMVCSPRQPLCDRCPLARTCRGKAQGIEKTLPRKTAKKARPVRTGKAFVIERADGAVLLRRRPTKGLLGGMLEVPTTPWTEIPAKDAPQTGILVEHTFTHFHLILAVERACDDSQAEPRDGSAALWVLPDDLERVALPTLMKKILKKVQIDTVRKVAPIK